MTHAERIEEYRRAIQAIVDHELHRRAVAETSQPWLPMWAVVVIALLTTLMVVGMAAFGTAREL
jgi:hypothetical protein